MLLHGKKLSNFLSMKNLLIVNCKPNFFKSYIYHSFMSLQKKDFIEIEFTGKTKDGEIFDSNIKKDIEKAGLKLEAKPFIFALGEGMFLSGVDEYLIGKDIGEHKIELESKKAFGLRDSKQLQMIPIKVFKQHNLMPYAGAVFNFDNRIAKVLTVSGGRVMVDFNHLLAGKDVIYTVKIFRKIEDLNEKIKAFNDFLFKQDLKFDIKDKTLIVEVEKPFVQFVDLFKDKYKDLFGLELKLKEIEKKKESKK